MPKMLLRGVSDNGVTTFFSPWGRAERARGEGRRKRAKASRRQKEAETQAKAEARRQEEWEEWEGKRRGGRRREKKCNFAVTIQHQVLTISST